MTIQITGSQKSTVHSLQDRLDAFSHSSASYQKIQNELDKLNTQNLSLADIPAHEDRLQSILLRFQQSIQQLKADAQRVAEKTDEKHIEKYFKLRDDSWYKPRSAKSWRYIDFQHKEPLKQLHQIANQILKQDYETVLLQWQKDSQERKQNAQAALEFSRIDQTFPPSCDRLLAENPKEYLRQSALYHYKLIQQGDHQSALTFGKLWMKNPPKEASWEDVEQVSLRLIEAAKITGNTNLAESCADLERWLEANPLPLSPDSVSMSPAQANTPLGRRIYLQGLMLLHNTTSLLNPKAFQTYQTCSLLYPDQPIWKVAQAFYHISDQKWVEAEKLLEGLPMDDPSVSHAMNHLVQKRQERIYSAVLDLSVLTLSRFLPTNLSNTPTFDIIHVALQFATHPSSRRIWLPRFLAVPQQPIPIHTLLLSASGTGLAIDTVDLIFRHWVSSKRLQKAEGLVSAMFQTASRTLTLYSNRELVGSITVINISSSLITLSHAYDNYQENRRSPTFRALLSTVQKILLDVSSVATVASYADLFSLVRVRSNPTLERLIVTPIARQISSALDKGNPKAQRNKNLLTASGIGLLASYRFYYDYPSLWAANVMQEAEWYCSQQKYDDALRFIGEAENSYFVGSTIPVIQGYARYIEKLKYYPALMEDPCQFESFMTSLDHALTLLKQNSCYTSLRNHLLQKKLVVALTKHDLNLIRAIIEERPLRIIIDNCVTYALNYAFYLALKNPAAASAYLHSLRPIFPTHTEIATLAGHLTNHAELLQQLPQLNLASLRQKRPLPETIKQWLQAIQDLQNFFKKHGGSKEVDQELQFYKLLLTFNQNSPSATVDALFKELGVEGHRRFSYALVMATKGVLHRACSPEEATQLLDKTCFPAYRDSALISKYKTLLTLGTSSFEEQMEALSSCVECLDKEEKFHNELHVVLSAYRIVLYFNAEQYARANGFLAREGPDSQVHPAVAIYLFEIMNTAVQAHRQQVAIDGLNKIMRNLGTWKHLPLFQTFLAYLKCKDSPSTYLAIRTNLIEQLSSVARLTPLGYDLSLPAPSLQEHSFYFETCLQERRMAEAKVLLEQLAPTPIYPQLCKKVLNFLIQTGEDLRQTVELKDLLDYLQNLNQFFSIPQSNIVENYIHFLACLEHVQKDETLTIYEKANDHADQLCTQLQSTGFPIPEKLKKDIAKMKLNFSLSAKRAGQRATAKAVFESIQRLNIRDELTLQFVDKIRQQFSNTFQKDH